MEASRPRNEALYRLTNSISVMHWHQSQKLVLDICRGGEGWAWIHSTWWNIRSIIQIQSSSFPTNVIICWQVTARTGWCLPPGFPCSLDPFSVTWTPSMKSAPRNKKATSSSPTPTMSLCKYFFLKNFEVFPWALSVSVLEFFFEMPRSGWLWEAISFLIAVKLTFNHSFRQIDSKNLKANENDFYYTPHHFFLYKIG